MEAETSISFITLETFSIHGAEQTGTWSNRLWTLVLLLLETVFMSSLD